MKKLLLSALAVCAFTFSNAQETETTETSFGFAKGDIFVEGNVGFGSTNDKNNDAKTSSFDFNPKVGYLLSDKLAVGVELMVGSTKGEDIVIEGTTVASGNDAKVSNFGAGVFARYYFLELGKRFKVNTELGLGFGSTKYDDGSDDIKKNGINAGLGLGLNYFVKDNIAITFGLSDLLSFSSEKYDVDGAENVTEFNANLNVMNNFFADAQFGLLFKF